MMEISLQDSVDRVSEKEAGLDTRIQEILRLEARLHDALEEKNGAASVEPDQSINSTSKGHEECEAALVIQEDVRLVDLLLLS